MGDMSAAMLLNLFVFTGFDDDAVWSSGWLAERGPGMSMGVEGPDDAIDAGDGADEICGGRDDASWGIFLASGAKLDVGRSDDRVKGIGRDWGLKLSAMEPYSTYLKGGEGDDRFVGIAHGSGAIGLFNDKGQIFSDYGPNDDMIQPPDPWADMLPPTTDNLIIERAADLIKGTALNDGIGIKNCSQLGRGSEYGGEVIIEPGSEIQAVIATGAGDDRVIGEGGRCGIRNIGLIDLGDDNDVMRGTGSDVGFQNEEPEASDFERWGVDLGGGDDLLVGAATAAGGAGIVNASVVEAGDGNDTIDALTGGFVGGGAIRMGAGDDVVKGFGSAAIDGGDGEGDVLILPEGAYRVSNLESVVITSLVEDSMYGSFSEKLVTTVSFYLDKEGSDGGIQASGVEWIGGLSGDLWNLPGIADQPFVVYSGNLYVDKDGVASLFLLPE